MYKSLNTALLHFVRRQGVLVVYTQKTVTIQNYTILKTVNTNTITTWLLSVSKY